MDHCIDSSSSIGYASSVALCKEGIRWAKEGPTWVLSHEAIGRFRQIMDTIAQNPSRDLVRCPTCGAACTIYSSGDGTNSFNPVTPYYE